MLAIMGSRGEGRLLPLAYGPDRHVFAAGQVHPAGLGRSGRVRAGSDPGTHQGRACQRTHQGADRRKPGLARPRSSGVAQGEAGAAGWLHGAPERQRRTRCPLSAACGPKWLGETCCASSTAPCPANAKPTPARRQRLCPGRLPARDGAGPRRPPRDGRSSARIVGAIKGADPDITLLAICNRLEAMRERTPLGRTNWQPSSVKMLLERAERLGLLD